MKADVERPSWLLGGYRITSWTGEIGATSLFSRSLAFAFIHFCSFSVSSLDARDLSSDLIGSRCP